MDDGQSLTGSLLYSTLTSKKYELCFYGKCYALWLPLYDSIISPIHLLLLLTRARVIAYFCMSQMHAFPCRALGRSIKRIDRIRQYDLLKQMVSNFFIRVIRIRASHIGILPHFNQFQIYLIFFQYVHVFLTATLRSAEYRNKSSSHTHRQPMTITTDMHLLYACSWLKLSKRLDGTLRTL